MRWFFLVSFVAALIICAILTSFLAFALVNDRPRLSGVVAFVLPQLALFGWAAQEMLRSYKGIGLDE